MPYRTGAKPSGAKICGKALAVFHAVTVRVGHRTVFGIAFKQIIYIVVRVPGNAKITNMIGNFTGVMAQAAIIAFFGVQQHIRTVYLTGKQSLSPSLRITLTGFFDSVHSFQRPGGDLFIPRLFAAAHFFGPALHDAVGHVHGLEIAVFCGHVMGQRA